MLVGGLALDEGRFGRFGLEPADVAVHQRSRRQTVDEDGQGDSEVGDGGYRRSVRYVGILDDHGEDDRGKSPPARTSP